jgi:hypothetical protein
METSRVGDGSSPAPHQPASAALGAMLDSHNETTETSPAADDWQFGEREP